MPRINRMRCVNSISRSWRASPAGTKRRRPNIPTAAAGTSCLTAGIERGDLPLRIHPVWSGAAAPRTKPLVYPRGRDGHIDLTTPSHARRGSSAARATQKPPSPALRGRGGDPPRDASAAGGGGVRVRPRDLRVGGRRFPSPSHRVPRRVPPSPATRERGGFCVALAEARGLVWRPGGRRFPHPPIAFRDGSLPLPRSAGEGWLLRGPRGSARAGLAAWGAPLPSPSHRVPRRVPPSPAKRGRGVVVTWPSRKREGWSGGLGGAASLTLPSRSATGPSLSREVRERGGCYVALAEARGLVWRPGGRRFPHPPIAFRDGSLPLPRSAGEGWLLRGPRGSARAGLAAWGAPLPSPSHRVPRRVPPSPAKCG